VIFAAAAAPAAAATAGIVVQLAGTERHLAPEEIDAAVDRPAGSYLLRAPGTTAEPIAHPPALSMWRLVMLAGGSPDAVSFVSIERPNGTLAILEGMDLADPPPFPDGPPIVWMDAGGTRYLRPLRGPSDVNAVDNIDITGGDLAVRVHQGPLLHVRARADRRSVPAGEPVALSAEIIGPARGQGLRFEWTFGDGSRRQGRAVRHRFRAPGVYEVAVTVNGVDDSGGSSAPLLIRVGDPPTTSGDTGGGPGERRRSPAHGPARGESEGGEGEGGVGEGGEGEPSEPGPSAPAGPTSSSPAPASRPPRQRPTSPSSPQPAPERERPRTEPRRQSIAPAGPVVRGALVSARTTTPLPDGTSASFRAGGPAAARRGTDPQSDPFALAAGILAAMALVGFGGRREWRELRLTRR
jgi:hypothetical protein